MARRCLYAGSRLGLFVRFWPLPYVALGPRWLWFGWNWYMPEVGGSHWVFSAFGGIRWRGRPQRPVFPATLEGCATPVVGARAGDPPA